VWSVRTAHAAFRLAPAWTTSRANVAEYLEVFASRDRDLMKLEAPDGFEPGMEVLQSAKMAAKAGFQRIPERSSGSRWVQCGCGSGSRADL